MLIPHRYGANLVVKFEINNPVLTVQEEAKFYQMSDFIADFGGYMGLLLGASCFTFYELGEAFAKKFTSSSSQKKIVTDTRKCVFN